MKLDESALGSLKKAHAFKLFTEADVAKREHMLLAHNLPPCFVPKDGTSWGEVHEYLHEKEDR